MAPAFPPRCERARLVRVCALLPLLLVLVAGLVGAAPAPAKKGAPKKVHAPRGHAGQPRPHPIAPAHAKGHRAVGHAKAKGVQMSSTGGATRATGGKARSTRGTPAPAARLSRVSTPSGGASTGNAKLRGGKAGGVRARSAAAPSTPATGPATARRRTRTRSHQRRLARHHAARLRGRSARPFVSTTPSAMDAAAGAFGPASPASVARSSSNPQGGGPRRSEPRKPAKDDSASLVTRTVRDVVEVVPDRLKLLVGGLAGLRFMLGLGYLFFAVRARRLDRQRRELLQEVGLVQTALLPPVPRLLGALRTSVAYRPADGPGAGGDFYDALTLSGGRAAFLLGDISGHGRDALARTAFMRYTLRAYLEARLEPRVALQVAGRVLDEALEGGLRHGDPGGPRPGSGLTHLRLRGPPRPADQRSRSLPARAGGRLAADRGRPPTGLRQTTLPLVAGAVACLYTDGMTEARTERGILGRGRLGDLLGQLGRDAEAPAMLELIASEAKSVPDDMACCLVAPAAGVTTGGFRTEELELSAEDVAAGLHVAFLKECGVVEAELERAGRELHPLMSRFGGAVLRVTFGTRSPSVQVLPPNVVSIEAASRRVTAVS